jgi:hypothetical protein
MHILIGLVVAAALLYFWLIGHWFARILMFLLLTVGVGLVLWVLLPPLTPPKDGNAFGFLIGLILAWPLAGIPAYYWRQRMRTLMAVGR